jgi:type IV pilus assembly protein PilW
VHGGGDATFDCVGEDPEGTAVATISPKAGTDFIVARRASSCALGTAGCAAAGGNFHIQVNSCFDPSDSTAPLPGIDFVISTDTDTATTMVFRERDDDCATAGFAPIYRMLGRIYFINDDDQLIRAELVGNEYIQTALVDGVETMRIEYGLDDVGADGLVDTYTDSPTAAQWPNVAMVRLSLVVRNLEPSGGFTDDRTYTVAGAAYTVPAGFEDHRRQLYVRTVSVRNIAGRRQS